MDLRESSLGFYRVWHVALGARHGLLVSLRERAAAPEALAHEHGLDATAVSNWCRGCHALGILTRDPEGRYQLAAEHALTLGDPASPEHLAHQFEYLAQKSLTFGDLDALLRGGSVPERPLSPTYALATRWDHVAFFESVLANDASLRHDLERGIDVLDLGAGEGGWVREATRRFPRSRVAAADLDTAPLHALDGVKVHTTDAIPAASFDLVHLGEVLAAARDPLAVLEAAAAALRPGGRLVAMEGLTPPLGRAPRGWGERLVLAMSLDFALDGSRFLRRDEIPALIGEAGLVELRIREVSGSLFVITARKPQT